MTKTLSTLVRDVATGRVDESSWCFVYDAGMLVTTNVDNQKSIIALRSKADAVKLKEQNPGLENQAIEEVSVKELLEICQRENCTVTWGEPA